ncbi:MAG: hypothetical protein CMO55_13620 [Verrucomicrobiales bacterium]|nr:hypothetical protein [Verrucomicrobiales bacterium]
MGSVRLLFFSVLQDLTGTESMEVNLPDQGLKVRELLDMVIESFPGLEAWKTRLLIAVDCEYADLEQVVKPGSEVALMPPVQGG